MNIQNALIQAARSVEALIPSPAHPSENTLENRLAQSLYALHEDAAKTAYQWAAAECFTRAYFRVGFNGTHGVVKSRVQNSITNGDRTLKELKAMCEPGYAWGAKVVTL
jgi:hypothetical protein